MFLIKRNISTACILLCVACAGVLASFFLPLAYVRPATAAILIIAAVAVLFLIQKRCILSFNRKKILVLIVTFIALYLMIYYVSGLFFGYYQALYRFSFDSLWRYILPILAIILASETVRHISLALDSKVIVVLTYVLCVLSDLATENGFLYFDTVHQFMDFVGMTLFPAITANLLFHYTSKRYGMLPGILYRCTLSLFPYLIPVIPNPPKILPAFALLFLPLLALSFIRALFEKKSPVAKQRKKRKWQVLGGSITAMLMIAFVLLISAQFRYGIIVIGTPSMTGELNVGDAVVYEAYEQGPIEENDVVIFQKDANTRIVHRVVEIQTVQGETRYITKGDANPDPDFGYITADQIVGVVRLKIPYIGYSSLWLKNIFKN